MSRKARVPGLEKELGPLPLESKRPVNVHCNYRDTLYVPPSQRPRATR